MQASVSELIRALMSAQQLSVRKVSARIASLYGGSVHGYTQQVNRILNDPDYDPSLTTVQKILTALNAPLWQVQPPVVSSSDAMSDRLDQLQQEISELKQGMVEVQRSIATLVSTLSPESP